MPETVDDRELAGLTDPMRVALRWLYQNRKDIVSTDVVVEEALVRIQTLRGLWSRGLVVATTAGSCEVLHLTDKGRRLGRRLR